MTQKQYRMVPAWLIIKTEILTSLYTANDLLAQYQNQPSLNNLRNFTNQILHLHRLLRTKIQYLKTDPYYQEYLNITKQLNNLEKNPPNPRGKQWMEIYELLQNLVEELGITKIEIQKEEELPEENALVKGHDVFSDMADD